MSLNLKKTITCIFLLISISLSGLSQKSDTTLDSTIVIKKTSHKIESFFYGNYGATALKNNLVKKLFLGGKITQDIKDKSLSKTKKSNRAGFEINYGIRYVNFEDTLFKKKPDLKYYIEMGSFTNFSTTYSKDFYKTVFYGNKQFENETAQLGKLNFIYSKFEKITFGVTTKDLNTSLGISLIIADKLNQYNIKQADLYTHPEGTDLTLDYNGKVKLSYNQNPGNFMNFNGTGLGIDFSTHVYKNKYTFSITNLGFVIWGKNSSFSNSQETIHFDGVEIENIFNTSIEEIEENAKNILPQLEQKTIISSLPTIFRFDKNLNKELILQPIYGVRYKLLSNYFPLAYGGIHYKLGSNFSLSGRLSYGGYSRIMGDAGIYFKNKAVTAGLESQNLTGLLFNNGFGIRVYFSVIF